jgi:hypothetical protein
MYMRTPHIKACNIELLMTGTKGNGFFVAIIIIECMSLQGACYPVYYNFANLPTAVNGRALVVE